jgi:hypothetical protein
MTSEQFWDKYINENNLDIFDIACDFFSKELPENFIEEYDAGEVIMEVSGAQENAKNFDDVFKFLNILQKHQPQLYQEEFQYFDDFLIDYHCFLKQESEVMKSFSNFISNPLQDVDKYLVSFKKIMFYQHTALLNQAISENFETIRDAEGLMGMAEYGLAMSKFYMILQEIYILQQEKIDIELYSSMLEKIEVKIDDKYISALETGLFGHQFDLDNLNELFIEDNKNTINILRASFLRYMHEKKFEFYLSGWIWDNLLEYWNEINKSKKSIEIQFSIKEASFEKFLSSLASSMFFNNTPVMIAILWGSVYVYDFLNAKQIISDKKHNEFIEISRKLKGKAIGRFSDDLWNANFVHSWEKPNSISETEFLEENKIFIKSRSFQRHQDSSFISEISDELENIGELSDFIIEDEKIIESKFDDKYWENLLKEKQSESRGNSSKNRNHKNTVHDQPLRVEKKVGRNDPCPCESGKKYKKCCG